MSDLWQQLLEQQAQASSDAQITYFGATDTRGKHAPFGIKREDRSRHTYVIGKTGMGKSTLLENLAIQDILRGEGVCFIDPHGGTAEKLLEYVPEHRVKDVLYFAPFDMQYPISFNVLEDVDADKRHFVVAGLMSTFEKIWADAWSARMSYILQNTIAALLEFPGSTLLGVNRMYIDKEYRKNVIAHISDPAVRSFWVDEYSKYTDRYAQEATPAIQNKIGQFASNALVRNIIGQAQSSFDMRELMDNKKIFIVNLSKGRVGEGNANLIGSMLITKIYLSAMSRADASASELRNLPPFFLYVDEFQNFANKSFADILSEARKYKLALTVAHQYIEQMEEEVRAAVFGNVGTMITFRVGSYDADVLEKEFAPIFIADDLVNLGARQVYLKLMIDGVSSQPFSATTLPPVPEPAKSFKEHSIAFSRAQFSRPRQEVEQDITDWVGKQYDDPEAEEKEQARQERRASRDTEGAGQARPVPSGTGARPASSGAGAPQPFGRGQARPPLSNTSRPWQGGAERRFENDRRGRTEETKRPPFGGGGRPPRDGFETSARPASANAGRPPSRVGGGQAPVRKETLGSDLRSAISKISPPPLPEESLKNTQPPVLQKPHEDGKGLTPEGREDLRTLLARFAPHQTAQSKSLNHQPAQNTLAEQSTGEGKPASFVETKSEQKEYTENREQMKSPSTPPEKEKKPLTPEVIKKMLYVEKPPVS